MARLNLGGLLSRRTPALATVLCLAIAPTLAFAAGAPVKFPTGPGSLNGLWFGSRFTPVRDGPPDALPRERKTADGLPPPLQPWAQAEVDRRIQAFKDGRPFAKLSSLCIPDGLPSMMFPAPELPIEFLETAGQVTVLFESMSVFRIIHLNEKHPDDPDPTFFGNSVGHWEGDTLVVDTIGLTDRTSLDNLVPHSDQLHVVERIRRSGKDTMEIRTTVDDPKTFTRPYTIVFPFKKVPGQRLQEFVCENNRNAPDQQGNTSIQLKQVGP